MTNNDQEKRKEKHIKRNREMIEKIKGSEDKAEKQLWINVFVWSNLKYFFTKAMRNVVVDYENDQTELDTKRYGKKVFNDGSAAKWLKDCDSAEGAKRIFEKRIQLNGRDKKTGKDNSFYYLNKICGENIREILSIDMDNIEEGEDYLNEICNTVRPLLEKSSTRYKSFNEDPGVKSGRIKADSIRRMKGNAKNVNMVSYDETKGKGISVEDDLQYLSDEIDLDEFIGLLDKVPEMKISDEDDELVRNEKIKKRQEILERVRQGFNGNALPSENEEIVLGVIDDIKNDDPEVHRIIMHFWKKDARIDILNKTYEEFHNEHYSKYKYMKPLDLARDMVSEENPGNVTEQEIKKKTKIIVAKSKWAMLKINEICTSKKRLKGSV